MTRPLSHSDYVSLATFRHALRVFMRFSEDAAREAGVTPAQHQLLLSIRGWDGPGQASIADLADRLQLKHHSTAELVSRAAEAGLVSTSTDPDDGRRQLLGLTDRGRDVLASLSLLHRDELRRFKAEMHDLLSEL